jgi:acyl carrier protein
MNKILKEYIISRYLVGEPPEFLTGETPLMEFGILDSLALIDFMHFVEETFTIQIESFELSKDNFGDLRRIEAFINRKQAAQSGNS